MQKNKFITSAFTLLVAGFITKILGMIIRVIYTRYIGEYGMSLYNLVMPTFSLVSSIVLFALPLSISRLVSSSKYSSKTIGFSALMIAVITNLLFVTLVIVFSKSISIYLLHEPLVYGLLICSLVTIPFISISSLLKGHFFGKQRMMPTSISNVAEQIVRLILLLIFLPKIITLDVYYGVMFVILLNIVSECFSIFVMYLYLPKKINIRDFKYNKACTKDIFNISLPSVSSKLIGNISYFFEPIIITTIMLYLGYKNDFIILQYGIYNSYAISLLLIPNFFIMAIANALLPEISKFYAQKNYKMVKRRIKQSFFISLLLGTLFCTIIFFYRTELLALLYKSTMASDYIKYIAFFFILFYLEAPLSTILVALGKNRASFIITLIGVVIKNVVLIFFLFQKMAIYSLLIAEIINIFIVVLLNIYVIKKALKKRH